MSDAGSSTLDRFRHAIARAGVSDLEERIGELEGRLPEPLRPLARVAYDYSWSWLPGGADVFRDVNPLRWEMTGHNPVRFLSDLWPGTMRRAERDGGLIARAQALAASVAAARAEPLRPRDGVTPPTVYLCAEFGVHASLPIYSGGLGVLAGDTLKQASDSGLPFVAFGLLYRRGYHRQRFDLDGRQLEYWIAADPKSLPMARVSLNGRPLKLTIDTFGRALTFQVWRVDVGRVPLYLLDTELPENDQVRRWTTSRLYDGTRSIRLAQYALLGMGSVRTLDAMGIDPGVLHLNEGHPALAALELMAARVERGASFGDAAADVVPRVVFTTHTPVAAGNETYTANELVDAFGSLAPRLGLETETFVDLFRTTPGARSDGGGLTQLALRHSRSRNAVSALHGTVAREMWRSFFKGASDVPIAHVTNGIHLPTFLSQPFRELWDRHLGERWIERPGEPATWEPVQDIPAAELWAARTRARRELIDWVRTKTELDRLQRGEEISYVRAAAESLDPDALTLGFARRLATYKRVYLLASDPDRLLALLTGTRSVQLLLSGKAHPRDQAGKEALQSIFALKRRAERVSQRLAVLEDYDLEIGRRLVGGCDVWLNLPRRPHEASGTSGMKGIFNGALQLSVLDGWWAEAYEEGNGWAIDGKEATSPEAADERDAEEFYTLLEQRVVPLFHERDEDGVPVAWCEMIKRSVLTCAARFTASRMLEDYITAVYGHVPTASV